MTISATLNYKSIQVQETKILLYKIVFFKHQRPSIYKESFSSRSKLLLSYPNGFIRLCSSYCQSVAFIN